MSLWSRTFTGSPKEALLKLLLVALSMSLALFAARSEAVPAMPAGDALFAAVQTMDTKLFDAYNTCDLNTLGNLVSDDLEFYHDQTGLSTGRKVFIDSIKNNICGKVHRDLVAGSLEVYPLHGYGAVEIGEHVFCDSGKCRNAIRRRLARQSSRCCGAIRPALGSSRVSSATTTSRTGRGRRIDVQFVTL